MATVVALMAGAALATVCGYVVAGGIPLIYFAMPNKSPLRFAKRG